MGSHLPTVAVSLLWYRSCRWIGVELDRRNHSRRAAIARNVVELIVHKPETVVTIDRLCESFQIPADAARRILNSLVRAGVVSEIRDGVWMNVKR